MLTTILSFLVVLGVLIFIHELGHYLAARHVGVRVEAFSIGFPPTAWGKQVGETEYRISWVPIGGYVKLFGQNVNDENPNDPTNYAAKSLFQRLYILAAGPAMNLLFALIFMPLVFLIGMDMPAYLNEPPLIKNVQQGSYAQELGIRANDEILAVNGTYVKNWEEVHSELAKVSTEETLTMEVDRAGSLVILEGSGTAFQNAGPMGWSPFLAPVVGEFTVQSNAEISLSEDTDDGESYELTYADTSWPTTNGSSYWFLNNVENAPILDGQDNIIIFKTTSEGTNFKVHFTIRAQKVHEHMGVYTGGAGTSTAASVLNTIDGWGDAFETGTGNYYDGYFYVTIYNNTDSDRDDQVIVFSDQNNASSSTLDFNGNAFKHRDDPDDPDTEISILNEEALANGYSNGDFTLLTSI